MSDSDRERLRILDALDDAYARQGLHMPRHVYADHLRRLFGGAPEAPK